MEQLNKSSIPFYKIRNCKVCKRSRSCKLCHKLKSHDHLFFKCPIAQVTWTWIRISMGWRENPVSLRSFEMLGSERGSQNWWKLIVLASVTRGVWKTRNVQVSVEVVDRTLQLVTQWTELCSWLTSKLSSWSVKYRKAFQMTQYSSTNGNNSSWLHT